ncbi:hypothetical protein ACFSO7_07460 [Bacillus sp. CGMCC 1.16607]
MNNNNQVTIVRKSENKDGGSGKKIIEWNVSDPTENIYAVVTPVKMN